MTQAPTNFTGQGGSLPTRNVALLMELVSRIKNRTNGLPGMGTFYGPTGYGKSMAVCVAAVTHQAYYVQMKSLWSRKYLLEMILQQMNIEPARTTAPMLEQISKQLLQSQRPLIIDEADLILQKGMIEVLRDIYESSQGTVILVGEENLPSHLEKIERVHGRMLDWVAAQPTGLDDARLFSSKHCAGISISDCLLEYIISSVHGSARYVCTNLDRIAEFARMHGLSSLSAETYTGSLFTGKAPKGRKL